MAAPPSARYPYQQHYPPSPQHGPGPRPGIGFGPTAPPPTYKLASFGDRLVALIIDSIIIVIPIIILSVIFALIAGIAAWAFFVPFSVTWGPFGALLSLLSLLIAFFYYYALEHRRGETIGKRVMKIRVVREDYRMLSSKKALIRTLFKMLYYISSWGLVFIIVDVILFFVTEKQQRLGDIIAKTIVIKSEGAPAVVAY